MRFLVVAAAWALSGAASAGTLEQIDLLKTTVASSAVNLAKCSGFWSAYAELQSNTATIEIIDSTADGAIVAAAYLLFLINADWQKSLEQSEAIAELEYSSWKALMIITSSEALSRVIQSCQTLRRMQDPIIQIMADHVGALE